MYGSSFSFKSPGRKPKFSPASTAGLVKIILFTCLFFKALTAIATPVYVFPVPAGPMANTISFFFIDSTSFFWFKVLALIIFPPTPCNILTSVPPFKKAFSLLSAKIILSIISSFNTLNLP